MTMPPFPHTAEDIHKLQGFELDYQKDISLVSTFGDMEQLGLEFDKSDDFAPPNQKAQEQAEEE